jgi:hypothetical protein
MALENVTSMRKFLRLPRVTSITLGVNFVTSMASRNNFLYFSPIWGQSSFRWILISLPMANQDLIKNECQMIFLCLYKDNEPIFRVKLLIRTFSKKATSHIGHVRGVHNTRRNYGVCAGTCTKPGSGTRWTFQSTRLFFCFQIKSRIKIS